MTVEVEAVLGIEFGLPGRNGAIQYGLVRGFSSCVEPVAIGTAEGSVRDQEGNGWMKKVSRRVNLRDSEAAVLRKSRLLTFHNVPTYGWYCCQVGYDHPVT